LPQDLGLSSALLQHLLARLPSCGIVHSFHLLDLFRGGVGLHELDLGVTALAAGKIETLGSAGIARILHDEPPE
jgi:hypothetical protein